MFIDTFAPQIAFERVAGQLRAQRGDFRFRQVLDLGGRIDARAAQLSSARVRPTPRYGSGRSRRACSSGC